MLKANEQPSRANTDEELTRQDEAFQTRLKANIPKLHLRPEVNQYWIERPQFMAQALELGFNSELARKEEEARKVLTKFIWSVPISSMLNIQVRRLIIWFLRQSKGLTEEIFLASPYDPIDQTPEIMELTYALAHFVGPLNSCHGPIVSFGIILKGVGCKLHLGCGSNENVTKLYLTYSPYDARKARRISWPDLSVLETVETVEESK